MSEDLQETMRGVTRSAESRLGLVIHRDDVLLHVSPDLAMVLGYIGADAVPHRALALLDESSRTTVVADAVDRKSHV